MTQNTLINRQSEPPIPPENWECCNDGCGDACVWQIYYQEKAAQEAIQHNNDTAE